MYNSTMEIDEAISEAEEESARTCETCGNPGTLNGGWGTLCDECRERRRGAKVGKYCRGKILAGLGVY